MRRILALGLVALLVAPGWAYDLTLHDTPTEVYFSPRGGAEKALVRHIGAAQKSIFVLAYGFTSGPISSALVEAAQRGIQVEVILDRSQRKAKSSKVETLAAAGIPVYIDSKHAIAHNKVMVLDRRTVITGSYNFTKSAETRNAENLLVLDAPQLARKYLATWRKHRKHSKPWASGSN